MNAPALSPASRREHWARGLGFTLAAVGSAVGLGNMWRFSYLTAENGGAAFVTLYVAMTLLVGLPVLLAELMLGRGAGRSPIQALAYFGARRWRALGALFVLAGVVVLSYYSVIAGWTMRYAFSSLLYGFPTDTAGYFEKVSSGWDAAGWHLGFMALTAFVVARGVRGGIERCAVLFMPVLGAFLLGLIVYAAALDGAKEGYIYYFVTDFSELSLDVAKDAAGQAFFSLSLGMGCILTYASYLKRDHNLTREAALVAVSDFGVALLAGLVVFPLLFALGLQNEVMGGETGTLGALFVVLPKAFANMQPGGHVVGLVFMAALSLAALTSAISLLEVVVSTLMDSLGWTRLRAVLLSGAFVAALGLPSAFSISVLAVLDALGGNFLLVFGGCCLAFFVGWRVPDPITEIARGSARTGLHTWRFLLRFVTFPVLALMSWLLLLDGVGQLLALFR